MNSKDKTREKLVGSLRKTKAVAGIGQDTKEGTEPIAPVAQKPTKPRPSRAKGRVVSAGASTLRPETVSADGYQSGRRVWPD